MTLICFYTQFTAFVIEIVYKITMLLLNCIKKRPNIKLVFKYILVIYLLNGDLTLSASISEILDAPVIIIVFSSSAFILLV